MEKFAGADFFNRAEHFHNQHAVVRDDGAAAFADDVRVRHLLRAANVADIIDDVVGVFLQRVVGGAVERRPAAVVIHPQPAADIEVFDLETHLVQLRVKPRGFLHRLLDRENVRHLRADVEMQQLQAMAEVLRLEHFGGGQNLRRAQAELGVFPAALGPAPRAFGEQPRANAEQRLDAELLGDVDDLPELLEFLDHHDDFLAQLDAEHGHLDELGVLVAVANDQAAHLALQRQSGEQFRLAAHLEAEIERLARVEDFLDHFAKLVDLDGKHAAVFALVIELGDGTAEREVDGLDAVPQDVLKPDQQRKLQPAPLGLLDHVREVHRHAGVLQRPRDDVSSFVNVEILRPPALDVVEVAGRLDVPQAGGGVSRIAHFVRVKPDAL